MNKAAKRSYVNTFSAFLEQFRFGRRSFFSQHIVKLCTSHTFPCMSYALSFFFVMFKMLRQIVEKLFQRRRWQYSFKNTKGRRDRAIQDLKLLICLH